MVRHAQGIAGRLVGDAGATHAQHLAQFFPAGAQRYFFWIPDLRFDLKLGDNNSEERAKIGATSDMASQFFRAGKQLCECFD